MDPSSSKRKEAKGKSKAAFDKLNLKEPIELSEHEEVIMGEVIAPEDIEVKFAGGSHLPAAVQAALTPVQSCMHHQVDQG